VLPGLIDDTCHLVPGDLAAIVDLGLHRSRHVQQPDLVARGDGRRRLPSGRGEVRSSGVGATVARQGNPSLMYAPLPTLTVLIRPSSS